MTIEEATIIIRAIADAPSDLRLDDLAEDLAHKLPAIDWRAVVDKVLTEE